MSWVQRLRSVGGGGGFRVRSPERDAESDRDRVAAIAKVIAQISEDVSRERSKLSERLQIATDQAALLVGTDDLEYLDRDEASEKALQDSEFQMRRANARLVQLRAFAAKLESIATSVDELTADLPVNEGTTARG